MSFAEGTSVYTNAKNNNKIVWKNLEVVDLELQKFAPVIVSNPSNNPVRFKFSFETPEANCQYSFFKYGTVDIDLGQQLYQKWVAGGRIGRGIQRLPRYRIRVSKPNAWIGNIQLEPNEIRTVQVRFNLQRPPTPRELNTFNVDLVQYESYGNKVTGGVRFTSPTTNSGTIGNEAASANEIDLTTPDPTLTNKCKATVEGVVFNDLNSDGVQNPDPLSGEVGLEGWTIIIKDGNRNDWAAVTDAQGNYSFDVPSPVTYTVLQVQRPGWHQTFPSNLTNHTARPEAGQRLVGLDFGNHFGTDSWQDMFSKEARGIGIIHSNLFAHWFGY
jgi:hypothetical protein